MQSSHTSSSKRSFILAGILLATFLAAIEGTVTGPAGPAIISSFGGFKLLSWIFIAYLLTMAVSTPIFGKLSDIYGRKPIFLGGSMLFLVGSLLCGFSQSMEQLIVFRAIQGIGAGAVIPVTFTIIGDIYTLKERAKIQGMLSSVWGISSLVGPLLGGYFVDYLSWRWIFGFNVPFGLVAILLIARYFQEDREKKKIIIDYWGALTFMIGMSSFLFALATGGQYFAWNSMLIIGCMLVAIIFLSLFFVVERRAVEPMVPLKLFQIRDIRVSAAANLFVSALLIGLTTYMPLWVQGIRGENAAQSGLTLAPMSIGWLLGSMWGAKLILSAGARATTVIGASALVGGAAGLALMSHSTSQVIILLLIFIYGLGFGFVSTSFTIIAQSSVGYQLRGASTALNTFIRTLGQTLGVAVFGLFVNLSVSRKIDALPNSTQVSQDDMNKLLTPEGSAELPAALWQQLRGLLENSLHALFILMAVCAVISLLIVTRMRNAPPSVQEHMSAEIFHNSK